MKWSYQRNTISHLFHNDQTHFQKVDALVFKFLYGWYNFHYYFNLNLSYSLFILQINFILFCWEIHILVLQNFSSLMPLALWFWLNFVLASRFTNLVFWCEKPKNFHFCEGILMWECCFFITVIKLQIYFIKLTSINCI